MVWLQYTTHSKKIKSIVAVALVDNETVRYSSLIIIKEFIANAPFFCSFTCTHRIFSG